MTLTKVTRNYQITIPKEAREKLNINIGDTLRVRVEGNKIIIEKVSSKRKRIKLGKKLSVEDIEKLIEKGFEHAGNY